MITPRDVIDFVSIVFVSEFNVVKIVVYLECIVHCSFMRVQPRSRGLFLNWEGKGPRSAGHMTPRISGCKNMFISVVSVRVCINREVIFNVLCNTASFKVNNFL